MSYSVLVATPTVAFGDLIQHTLEELGHFDVKMAYTTAEALAQAGSIRCGAAILDGDLGETELRLLAQQLSQRCPDMRMVIFPPDNDMGHSLLHDLPDPLLMRKPFYLPDLIEVMNGLLEGKRCENEGQSMAWVDPAGFEKLLSQTTARVAIVCERDGGAVFAGHQPDGMQTELKALAQRFWQRGEYTDLVRFDRLEAGQLECLLFLTGVVSSGETVLGLVFPVSTPLSKVRAQAGPLVQALRECKASAAPRRTAPIPARSPSAKPLAAVAEARQAPDVGIVPGSAAAGGMTAQEIAWFAAGPSLLDEDTQSVKADSASLPDEPFDWEGEEAALKNFNLSEMLGSIPSPDPNSSAEKMFTAPSGNGWLPEGMFAGSMASMNVPEAEVGRDGEEDEGFADPDVDCPVFEDEQHLGWEQEGLAAARTTALGEMPAGQAALESNIRPPVAAPQPFDGGLKPSLEAQSVHVASSEGSSITALAGLPGALTSSNDEDDNRANVLTSLTNLDQLEPVAVGMSLLNYTCVLVPRLPGHFLTGELSEKLTQWVQQLCLAFGWRLEGISMRPEYLQWTVQVTPAISPGNVVKIIRQRTSDYIFSQFLALQQDNPSGDFWANGYLIVSGAQPPSVGLLRDYIAQTRRRQGVGRVPGDNSPRLTP